MPQGTDAALWLIDQGLTLIPLSPRSKIPSQRAWATDSNSWLTTASALHAYLRKQPAGGCSLLHAPSGTAALDIDRPDWATIALSSVGINLEELLSKPGLKIVTSNGLKPVYRVPEGAVLTRVALAWPSRKNRKEVVFELRAGKHHDAIPPTIHPITGRLYAIAGDLNIPAMPEQLLELWQDWEHYHVKMLEACPWRPRSGERHRRTQDTGFPSVVNRCGIISQYNASNPVGDVLERHGYTPSGPGRWCYSGSKSGSPGVVMLPQLSQGGHPVIWSHHVGDPLADRTWDAAGLELLLAHGINTYTASPAEIRQGLSLLGGDQLMDKQEQPHQWLAMLPLPPAQSSIATLTPDYLPSSLCAWVVAEAQGAGVPLEMLAIPVIHCAGAIIGTRLTLRNSANAPAVPANLWALTCSPPGTRKTYALDLGVMALRELQDASDQRAALNRSQREAARDVAAAHLASLHEALKGKTDVQRPTATEIAAARQALTEAEAALIDPTYLTSDATIEAIGGLLQHNPNGIAIVRDELPGWLASFERSGREQDRAFFLESANGTNPYTVNRIQRGKLHIPKLCLSVIGNIQPHGLSKLVGSQIGAGDGLLQRFQLFIWVDTLPEYNQESLRRPMPEGLRSKGLLTLQRLADLNHENMGSVDDAGRPVPLRYSVEAQAIYDQWEAKNAQEVRDKSRSEAYRAHIAKQPSTYARIALVMHCLEVISSNEQQQSHEVSTQAATLAAHWCNFLALHAQKLWGEGTRQDVVDAQEIYRLISRGRIKEGKQADLTKTLRETGSEIRGERLQAALAVLVNCNIIRLDKATSGTGGGRPVIHLRIHPELL